MKINSICSEANSTLKTIRALHKRQNREKEGLFLLEGSHCLIEALKRKLDLKAIVASKSYLQSGIEEIAELDIEQIAVVEDRLFESLATTHSSCGILAIAPIPKEEAERFSEWQPRVVLVADAVQDPGNLGTLIRSAYAAQVGGLVILKGSVDHFNPKVVRAAAGALFGLKIISNLEATEAVDLFKREKMRLIISEANANRNYFDANLKDSVAIVLSNEGQGVNPLLKAAADESISIPMNPESESLNVAISGGIILFEALRQRLAGSKN
ncbi:MAG: RNA methyltransferase [Candidatus Obscuribacterales bacterium]|nr:RNA methyltransferase [Candidatus Obscuribacterales bacterium]